MNTQIIPLKQNETFSPLRLVYNNESVLRFLINKEAQIAVVGLENSGLQLALQMANKFSIIGYDENKRKIESLQKSFNSNIKISSADFIDKDINFYHTECKLKKANVYIITAPTPISLSKKIDLEPLKKATETVAKYIDLGDVVIFESTIYPGCTEEVCIPILEINSGLTFNKDFTVGYSPEWMQNTSSKKSFSTKKIVAASTPESLNIVTGIYENVFNSKIHKAPSIRIAETIKILGNSQNSI